MSKLLYSPFGQVNKQEQYSRRNYYYMTFENKNEKTDDLCLVTINDNTERTHPI